MNDDHDWHKMLHESDTQDDPEYKADHSWIGYIGLGILLCLLVEVAILWTQGVY